jgi:hypothetical protein
MNKKSFWLTVSLFNLCIVGLLGFTLRSKILFDLPWINYLNVLDAHSHFTFGGWVTLALLALLVHELLPETTANRKIYTWIFSFLVLTSAGHMLVMSFTGNVLFANVFFVLFLFTAYLFGWFFIKHIRQVKPHKTVYLLSVAAILSLVLSSVGPFTIFYLHAIGSSQMYFFRDALYVYLHLQYNGFFALSVFALLFNRLFSEISVKHRQNFHIFSILLCASILPSLFLSFLWQDPNALFRLIAIVGSILTFASAVSFLFPAIPILRFFKSDAPVERFLIVLSMSAFLSKMILQCFTIFKSVGNAVFGDRPVIIGFLHLVFLAFITPFILAWLVQAGILSIKSKLTWPALITFILSVIANEGLLMVQGVGAMFLQGSNLYSWFLWLASIGLTVGAILIFIACLESRKFQNSSSTAMR